MTLADCRCSDRSFVYSPPLCSPRLVQRRAVGGVETGLRTRDPPVLLWWTGGCPGGGGCSWETEGLT